MNLVYSVQETRGKIREIQSNVKNGVMSELANKASHESIYMISSKMLESIHQELLINNILEYDEKLKVYTVYNEILPNFYGEGTTEKIAISNMVDEVIVFSKEYLENVEMFSGIFSGIQQFLISIVILNLNNKQKIMEILKIV